MRNFINACCVSWLVTCGITTAVAQTQLTPSPTPAPAAADAASTTIQADAKKTKDDTLNKPKTLVAAIDRVNLKARSAIAKHQPIDMVGAKEELQGELHCEATILETRTSEAGESELVAEVRVSRPIRLRPLDAYEDVRSAERSRADARKASQSKLKQFESAWRPVKNGRPQYVRTKWKGCSRYWPRISKEEYNKQRSQIIEEGKRAISNADDTVKAVRVRVQEERALASKLARIVRVEVRQQAKHGIAKSFEVGQQVQLKVRVDDVDFAKDGRSILDPSQYVATVRASTIEPPVAVAHAGR